MISKEELSKRFEGQLKTVASGDLAAINAKITEHLQFAIKNYDSLTPEAQQCTDNALGIMKKHYGEAIDKLPESREKRKLKRIHAIAGGEHFKGETLLKKLESVPELKDANSKEFRKIFIIRLQTILDLLYDVKQNTLKGAAEVGQLILLSMCVDELLSAFHLCQHHYVTQAYTHIRTIFEHIDKIELFRVKPEWAELWCGNDDKKSRIELSPAGVRQKLGKKRYDPIYGLLSMLGPHGTFKSVQTRTAIKTKPSIKGNPEIQIWVGGCSLEHNIVWINLFALHALFMVLLQITRSFETFLNQDEMTDILKDMFDNTIKYTEEHFLKWAKENGKNIDEQIATLDAYREELFGTKR